jgi:hypothetical protein
LLCIHWLFRVCVICPLFCHWRRLLQHSVDLKSQKEVLQLNPCSNILSLESSVHSQGDNKWCKRKLRQKKKTKYSFFRLIKLIALFTSRSKQFNYLKFK